MQIDLGIPGARPRTDADIARVDRLTNMLMQKDKLMVEVRKHLGRNPKPHQDRVILPDISDRINHTRTKQRKPTVHSLVAGRNVHQLETTNDKKELNPFSVLPQDLDIVRKVKNLTVSKTKPPSLREPCMAKSFCSKPCNCLKDKSGRQCQSQTSGKSRKTFSYQSKNEDTLNGCQVNKQFERLQIPRYALPPSMLDYQKNYFTCVRDRPFKERFKRSEFSRMQRTTFFKTMMSGHIKDGINRRKEQQQLDMWELSTISKELDQVERMFKKFIDHSNEESVSLVKNQLHAGYQREEVEANLIAHKGIMNSIKADIFRLEGELSTLLLCRDLLLKLSPSVWRMQYLHQARHFKEKIKWRNELARLHHAYCRYNPEPGKDFFLDEAMELLFKEVETMGPPRVYFTESWQISMVLRRKELDCINQVGDIVCLERKISEIDALFKELTKHRRAEMKLISETMDEGHAKFEYQKKRVEELEEQAQTMIPNCIDALFSGDIILETIALIEVLYADFFGKSRQRPKPLQMMVAIDEAIRIQREELAEIDPKVLKFFEKKIDAEEAKTYKAAMKAKRAQREMKSFVKSARAMMSLPPRRPRTWKLPVRRSNIPPLKKPKSRASSKRNEQFQHYQLSGIMNNDDLEESLDRAINAYLGLPIRPNTPESENSTAEHSSIISYASTESLQKAIYDKAEHWTDIADLNRQSLGDDQREELMMIEMDYDSNEELIKQNYEKKGTKGEKPPVLYDAKRLDDRFMVEGDNEKLTEKNRIHENRNPKRISRNNALSWR